MPGRITHRPVSTVQVPVRCPGAPWLITHYVTVNAKTGKQVRTR